MIGKTVRKVALLILVVLMLLSIASIGSASGTKKTLEAWYMNIKIKSNGQEVYTDTAPFIVDGITYVPVRMMANIFNKNIDWDPVNYIISVTDKPDPNISSLTMQLYMKDNEIKNLEARIKELEESKSTSSATDIDSLEDELNDYYDEYKGIDFDITLSGTKTKVTVKIEFSMKKYKTKWNSLTTKNITSYLQDICDDIRDVFPKASITGYFKDNSGTTSSKMYQFSTSSKGVVSLDSDYDVDIGDLEDDLNDLFYDYFSGIIVSIELEGDEEDITYNVYVDYDKYKSKWDALTNKQIEYFMEDICYEIEDVFEDAYIIGYVYKSGTTSKLAKYDPSKSTKFTRY